MRGAYGAEDGDLVGVGVDLFDHEGGGGVVGEGGRVGEAFGKCGSGDSGRVAAAGVGAQRLGGEVLRRENALPLQFSPELLPERQPLWGLDQRICCAFDNRDAREVADF